MNRRAVITAWGCLGAWGGTAGLRRALRDGIAHSSVVDRAAGFHAAGSPARALLVSAETLAEFLPRGELRRASRLTRMTAAATREATLWQPGDPRTAVVLATCFGPVSASEDVMRTLIRESPLAVAPFTFAESVANAPAAQVAIATGARGPNLTIVQAECGPIMALARGRAEIESGRRPRVLVGAFDEAPPVLHACLGRLGALARENARGDERAQPFGAHRSGVLQAEGAAMLALEDEGAARERSAPVLARVIGTGSAFDASASRVGWGTGAENLGGALKRTLARAGLSPDDVGLIVSGASGCVAGDELEARTLRSAWGGAELPPIVAPKAFTGEWGGGSLAAALAIVSGCDVAPTPLDGGPPRLDLPLHPGGPLPAASVILLTGLGSGGAAAWALLERN